MNLFWWWWWRLGGIFTILSFYFWCQSWHHFLVCDPEVLACFLSGPLWFLTTAFLNLEFTLAPGLKRYTAKESQPGTQTVLKALLFYQQTPRRPSQDCDHGGNGGDSNSAPTTLPISLWPRSGAALGRHTGPAVGHELRFSQLRAGAVK